MHAPPFSTCGLGRTPASERRDPHGCGGLFYSYRFKLLFCNMAPSRTSLLESKLQNAKHKPRLGARE